MITDKDRRIIQEMAARYGATRVILFGSSLTQGSEARDIDIAVEGIAEADFFAFYGELLSALSKPVDVIDLSQQSRLAELARQEGGLLHG